MKRIRPEEPEIMLDEMPREIVKVEEIPVVLTK
jgi:hypothetical protein